MVFECTLDYVERSTPMFIGRVQGAAADLGQSAITDFPVLGDVFSDLTELDSLVRVEIAYHGQAEDAGDDLSAWLSDFWTGAGCPQETPNPNPAQPHCPV